MVFIEKKINGYIIGVRYYNGRKWVKEYVKSVYGQTYSFTLDYVHAKNVSLNTAKKHKKILSDIYK